MAKRCGVASSLFDRVAARHQRDFRITQTAPSWSCSRLVQRPDGGATFLSAVTLGETQDGIEKTREQDGAKAKALEDWLEQLINSSQTLAMDADTFRVWAKLMHRQTNTVYEDAMIAATAKVHRLIVTTRNTSDFAYRFLIRLRVRDDDYTNRRCEEQ